MAPLRSARVWCAAVGIAFAGVAPAQPVTTSNWVGFDFSNPTAWESPANWNPDVVPNNNPPFATFAAVVGPSFSAAVSSPIVVNSLTLNGSQFTVNSGTAFGVVNALSVNSAATATLLGGTLAFPGMSSGAPGSLVNDGTVRGSGAIGSPANPVLLNNNQVLSFLDANDPSSSLTVYLSSSSGSTANVNRGRMRAIGGSSLTIRGGPLDNVDGTIRAESASTVRLQAPIRGGTLQTGVVGSVFGTMSWENLLDGSTNTVSNSGILSVPATGRLLGTLNNTVQVTVGGPTTVGVVLLDGPATLTGSGQFILVGGQIITNPSVSGAFPLTVAGQFLRGYGIIGQDTGMPLSNSGVILADIDTRVLTVNTAGASTNANTMLATGGGRLLVRAANGTFTNDGTLRAESGGTLDVVSLSNYAATTLRGGRYEVAGTGSALKLPGDIVTNAAAIVLDGPTADILNRSTNTSALSGLTTNTSTGRLTLRNGRALSLPALSNAGALEVRENSTLTVTGNFSQTAGSTNLVDPASTLNVAGTFSLTGGRFQGRGTVNTTTFSAAAGTLAPGASPGRLNLSADLVMSAATNLEIEVGGTGQGTTYDLLDVTGSASLGGSTLLVTFFGGFENSVLPSDTFAFLTAGGGVSGIFGGVPNGGRVDTADGLGSFQVNYTGNGVVLSNAIVGVPEPGAALLCVAAGVSWCIARHRRGRHDRRIPTAPVA